MSEARLLDPAVTIEGFDAFLEAQRDGSRWELVWGRIVAMTNPSEDHEQIVSNIGAPLKLAMDAIGCRTFQGGIGVQRSEETRGTNRLKPNVVVRCGPRVGRQNYVVDPLIVVEVLSPSTMDLDRGDKLRFYKALPTLRHVALIYQDQMRVEHYRKTDEGWPSEVLTFPEDMLCFEAVRFEIGLGRIYSGAEPTARR